MFDRIAKKKTFSEHEAAHIIQTIASAVRYMHSIGIVHRDLKPENLVFCDKSPDSVLKITDFGLAKYLVRSSSLSSMNSIVGTIGYMAPEILRGDIYGPEVDLWSIGVILFVLLCGYPPFYDPSPSGLFGQIRKGAYCFAEPHWNHISQDAKFVVFRLLAVNPKDRMTLEELLDHPWVKGNSSPSQPSPRNLHLEQEFCLRLSAFNTRRKIRRSLLTLLAIRRFQA